MRRALLLLAVILAAVPAHAQTVRTSQIVINCVSASRLSLLDETVIYRKCSDGKNWISTGGAAFVELNAGGSSGTVTSVALTAPAIFTVTGSPVTTSGTIAISLQSQTANLVFASPNGAPGTPTFRALAAADVPGVADGDRGDVAVSGGAWTVESMTVADSTDATSFIAMFDSATGPNLPVKTDAGITYNASTGTLTAANLTVSGTCTGCGSSPANMVTTDTVQTITALKTFQAATNSKVTVSTTGGNATSGVYVENSADVKGALRSTSDPGVLATGGVVIETTTNHPIAFRTNSSGSDGSNERLRINTDGTMRARASILQLESPSSGTNAELRLFPDTSGVASGVLKFGTTSANHWGIYETVNAGAQGNLVLYDYATSAERLNVAPSTGNVGVGTTPDGTVKFKISGGEWITGNLGIGLTPGSAKLTVGAATGGVTASFTDSANSTVEIGHPSSGVAYVRGTAGSALRLGSNNADVLTLDTSSNATFAGTIKERGRSTALGEWTNVAYNAADFTANGSMTWTVDSGDVTAYAYSVVGKTMFLAFTIQATDVGGTANNTLQIKIPGGYTGAIAVSGGYMYHDAGAAPAMGVWQVTSGGSVVALSKPNGVNWTITSSDNTQVYSVILIPIN